MKPFGLDKDMDMDSDSTFLDQIFFTYIRTVLSSGTACWLLCYFSIGSYPNP